MGLKKGLHRIGACGGVSPKTRIPRGEVKGGQSSRRGGRLLKENDIVGFIRDVVSTINDPTLILVKLWG